MDNILVLLSTYNGEKYIEEQLDSILAQENCHVDILIRDDGSTDGTLDILHRYCEENANIKLSASSGRNLKPAKSFMQLINDAAGDYEYYAFADQDDIWLADKLYRGIMRLRSSNIIALYCSNAELVDSDGNKLGRLAHRNGLPVDNKSILIGCGYMGCTMVMNKSLVEELKIHPVSRELVMHDYYVSCVCIACGWEVFYENKPSMYYRQHGSNTVGVSISKLAALKNRFSLLSKNCECSISETALSILELYDHIPYDVEYFLRIISDYKNNLYHRVKLAFEDYKLSTFNTTVFMRLLVLFGKR